MMKKILAILAFFVLVVSSSYAQDGKVTALNADGFKSKISNGLTPDSWEFKGKRPVIVDFFATWCGPCKMLAPTLDKLALKYKGKVDFYKVDVDKSPDLSRAFGIESIPTLLFIPVDGAPELMEGAPSRDELEELIEYSFFE